MEKGRAFPLNHCVPMHKIAQYGEQLFGECFSILQYVNEKDRKIERGLKYW